MKVNGQHRFLALLLSYKCPQVPIGWEDWGGGTTVGLVVVPLPQIGYVT